MYHIMIVEDDETIRQELAILLKNALYQVSEITDFSEAAIKIKEISPDLILLDINLPGTSGMDICKKLRKDSDIPIIFLTGNDGMMDELSCLQQGGDDFIAKPFKPPILLARIAALLKRTTKENNKILRYSHRNLILDVALATIEANESIKAKGPKIDLTKTELKILHYLFIKAGQFVSRAHLTNYLWDNQVFIDDNTLSVNITRIRGKINQLGIEDFIETKRGLGYKI